MRRLRALSIVLVVALSAVGPALRPIEGARQIGLSAAVSGGSASG
jgi:hypothetical protein